MIQKAMHVNEFLDYLAHYENGQHDPDRIPSLGQLSEEMGLSIAKLREQLEAARTLGLVEVRPRTGIRRKPYSFGPAVTTSLLYGVARNRASFAQFSGLRIRLETAFWYDAVCRLTDEDHVELRALVARAWDELNGDPIIIPHPEHRKLHMTIFRRLDNSFVLGLLEAYWNAYEAVELNSYAHLSYLQEVWTYHERIVDAICRGDAEGSLTAFTEHTRLLRIRSKS